MRRKKKRGRRGRRKRRRRRKGRRNRLYKQTLYKQNLTGHSAQYIQLTNATFN
jgi:hypothetical protein